MSRSSSQWERTRKNQLALVRWGIFLLIVLGIAIVSIVHWPVRRALERQARSEFEARSLLAAATAANEVNHAMQLALQLPSRTIIRLELVNYLQGSRSRNWYTEFAEPKLLDAVEASPELLGAYRTDPAGEILLVASIDTRDAPTVKIDSESARYVGVPNTAGGDPAVFVQVPIVHPGYGLAGFDMVKVSLLALEDSLSAYGDTLETGIVELSISSEDRSTMVISAGSGFDPDVELVDLRHGFAPSWTLRVAAPAAVVFQTVRREANILAGIVGAVSILALAVGAWLLLFLSRRTLAETEELDRIVGEQTVELRTLLREIHHRVKNDISLITSFLSARAHESSSHEARDVLLEAESSLQLMGEVYDLLHTSGRYATIDMQPILTDLFDHMAESSSSTRLHIDSKIDELTLPRASAIPLGIIAHELITNAQKHGILDDDVRCRVTLTIDASNTVCLQVSNNGSPFPQEVIDGSYGFGLTMIRALSTQLGGSIDIANEPTPTVTVFASAAAQ